MSGYPRERAGKHKGRALQLLKQRRAAIESGTARTKRQLRANTLDALAALWKRDKADKDMRSLERAYGQYQQHISPRLGKREPDSVRPREVLASFGTLTSATRASAEPSASSAPRAFTI